ncbi:pentapeptide repeat-containing protein [Rhodococcoides corynebacterioides]|uniref:Pentapeptide repeat-containing protein n=1 Tax=Rhodococcoides corynebacterioides TaxID=53972 RepID=A0ABS7P5N1_9NOCA|nr:pentapeptide repeat-containing protein [Rhodococcus corynebacterioides]MBY6366939.1 pentapeptide repeat-containing protein [Rhodococcus corynebacterioides]MBY6407741.1 pentapeptide repeat-containing protein [Rhodococcus corynebacterioides]
MNSGDAPVDEPKPEHLWRWVIAGTIATTVIGAALFYLFAWQQGGHVWNWSLRETTGQQIFDSARTTVALVGVIGLGGAALLAYRRQRTTERSTALSSQAVTLSRQQFTHDEVRILRERYTSAAEQLGSDSFAIRLAGVYAFASLADDWAEAGNTSERQVCIDVLCAYLRTPTGGGRDLASATDADSGTSAGLNAQEEQVRSTIVRVIADHTRDARRVGARTAQVLKAPWKNCDFDLRGARLTNIDWSHCQFLGALDLSGAHFISGADFSSCVFERVSFVDARFGSEQEGSPTTVRFQDCLFTEADFEWARFFVSVDFARATNRGTLRFDLASFRGLRTNFHEMTFETGSGTTFNAADFAGAVRFTSGTFEGAVELSLASFAEVSTLSFRTPKSWDVPPTLPWSEDGEVPSFMDSGWPPPIPAETDGAAKSDARDAAARGATEPKTDN